MKKKICFKCEALLPLSDFYKHPMMADGHLGKCKECNKLDVTENRAKRAEHYREFDRLRGQTPERKTSIAAKNQRRLQRDPQYAATRNLFARAIKNGVIKRVRRCERCNANGAQGHHDDYSKPLDVMWLCPVCHAARHRELGRLSGIRKF